MFKEYYCVLLIMDKLFDSWHTTNMNAERLLLGNIHIELTVGQPK